VAVLPARPVQAADRTGESRFPAMADHLDPADKRTDDHPAVEAVLALGRMDGFRFPAMAGSLVPAQTHNLGYPADPAANSRRVCPRRAD
jgi:hypothetical protein